MPSSDYPAWVCREVRRGVTISDINTLEVGNSPNSVIVNQYLSILINCGTPGYATLHTSWYEELIKGMKPGLPNDWRIKERILAPVCIRSHWSLLVYSPSSNAVEIYSSSLLTEAERICAQILQKYVDEVAHRNKEDKLPRIFEVVELPRQTNECDSGVYVCMFARCITQDRSFNFTPELVTEYRPWLQKEIREGRLLTP